jgi:competence protein ComFB
MINALEDVVRQMYAALRASHGADSCTCLQCQDDVVTLVMNHARPRYITTGRRSLGAALTRVHLAEEGTRAELTVLILDAMRTVSSKPQH